MIAVRINRYNTEVVVPEVSWNEGHPTVLIPDTLLQEYDRSQIQFDKVQEKLKTYLEKQKQ